MIMAEKTDVPLESHCGREQSNVPTRWYQHMHEIPRRQ